MPGKLDIVRCSFLAMRGNACWTLCVCSRANFHSFFARSISYFLKIRRNAAIYGDETHAIWRAFFSPESVPTRSFGGHRLRPPKVTRPSWSGRMPPGCLRFAEKPDQDGLVTFGTAVWRNKNRMIFRRVCGGFHHPSRHPTCRNLFGLSSLAGLWRAGDSTPAKNCRAIVCRPWRDFGARATPPRQ